MTAETGLFEADEVKPGEPQVYEIGYHFLPTLSDEAVQTAVKDLTNFLQGQGAQFVGEKLPQKIDLAYPIEKRVSGQRTPFSSAYFGWVAFEIEPRATHTVKQFMDTNQNILRYLLVSTTKDEVTAVMEGKVLIPTAVASTEAIAAPKRAEEQAGPVSEEALSKALESLDDEEAK